MEYYAGLYHVEKRDARTRIRRVLDTLGIAAYADRRFHTYSTGIRQKFAIARGLLTRPRILFLDEPTRALDPIAADEMRTYIADHIVGELGHTVLLATHTLSEAEAICHRVAIIRNGHLVAAGTLEELRSRMQLATVLHVVVTGISGSIPKLIDDMGLGSVTLGGSARQTTLRIPLDGQKGTLSRVMQTILDSGGQIETCTTRQPTLDDIYRAAHA